jgi:hypothetical protein
MRMMVTNVDWSDADDESFFVRLGEPNTTHILSLWSQIWNDFRLIESRNENGVRVMKVKEEMKLLRTMLQPSSPAAYDMPKVGNREIEVFKALLDPANDWWTRLNRVWDVCHDMYVQEKTPLGDPYAREGALRDCLLATFNSLPEPWGDFLLLVCHRVFPRLNTSFLEGFTTNFGRTESAREAVLPYTMRYLRQVQEMPEIRLRETREEDQWWANYTELEKYRNSRTPIGRG